MGKADSTMSTRTRTCPTNVPERTFEAYVPSTLSVSMYAIEGRFDEGQGQVVTSVTGTGAATGSTLKVGSTGSSSTCTRRFSEPALVIPLPAYGSMEQQLRHATLSLNLMEIRNAKTLQLNLCGVGFGLHTDDSEALYHGNSGCKSGETMLQEGVFNKDSALGSTTVDITNYVRSFYASGQASMGGGLFLRLGASEDIGCGTSCGSGCPIRRYVVSNDMTVSLEVDVVSVPPHSRYVTYDAQTCTAEAVPEENGDKIPDFSSVGFKKEGTHLLPATVAAQSTIYGCGAGVDCTSVIQDAIDEVSLLPVGTDGLRGAVLLKAGRYEILDTVRIRASGVVLRGEGPDSLIVTTAEKQYDAIEANSPSGGKPSEVEHTRVAIADSYVPVGATSFRIDTSSCAADSSCGFAVGDDIIVYRPGTAEWIHAIGMDNITNCEPPVEGRNCRNWVPHDYELMFERTITSMEGNLVTLDIPIVQAIDTTYGGGAIYKYTFERLSMVGVEDLGFDSTYTFDEDEEHGWNAVKLERTENGWIQRIQCKHYGYACGNIGTYSKFVTVSDCHSTDAISQITGGRRYTFNVDGQMNLVTGCSARDGRHDFVTGSRVCGPNVFHNGSAFNSHADTGPHHRWATGQLYDNILTDGPGNAWNSGYMGSGHGWRGQQVIFWNSAFSSQVVESAEGAINWAIGNRVGEFIGPQGDKRFGDKSMEFPLKLDSITQGRGGAPSHPALWDSPNQMVQPWSLYEAQFNSRS